MTCHLLHSSGYSSVFLGTASGCQEAPLSCFKVYNKDYPLQPRHWLNISRECCILSRLLEDRVDGIVHLLSVADTPKHFSLQFKPCLGGNLYQCLERRECCDEVQLCVQVIIPLLNVLHSLHSRGIIHRDIKPENIFFEDDGKLVLGDFGLAIDSTRDKPCSRVGTQDYMAPEVLAQPSADTVALRNIPSSMLTPYDTAVDIWALGTLVHEALTGKVPFYHPEPSVMALKAQYGRANNLPHSISPECKAFVDAVLQKQPGKRPSAAELLQHPWVLKYQPAAAAAVAARVKAKVLAQLQLDRPSNSAQRLFARSAPSLPAVHSVGLSRAAAAPAATPMLNHHLPAAAGAGSGSMESQGPSLTASSISSSLRSKSTASMSNSVSSGSGSGSPSTVGRLDSRSGPLLGTTAQQAAGAAAPKGTGCELQAAKGNCCCKSRKVSFDCAALQQQQENGPAAERTTAAALGAAIAVPAASQSCARQLPLGRVARSSGASGASKCIASAERCDSCDREAAEGAMLLQLLPALSEPVLIDVGSQLDGSEHGAPCSTDNTYCGCTNARRTSQSGTCSAAAATAGKRAALSWGMPTAAAGTRQGGSTPCSPHCGNSSSSCEQLTTGSTARHPSGRQHSLSAQDEQRPSGSSLHNRVCKAAQRCADGSMPMVLPVAAAAGAADGFTEPSAANNCGVSIQKLPALKASTVQMPAAGIGSAASPKPLLCSPPKPALLMQRLRSFARDRHAQHNSKRRHSVDLDLSSRQSRHPVAPTPNDVCAIAATSRPFNMATGDQDNCHRPDPLPGLTRPHPSSTAGLASPLAALSKLGGFLSPPSTSSAACNRAGDHTAAPGRDLNSDASRIQGDGHSSRAQQRTPAPGDVGTAALLVGLAGAACGDATASWVGQEPHHSRGLVSPTAACRTAKGVCLKVLHQVLRHQQQA